MPSYRLAWVGSKLTEVDGLLDFDDLLLHLVVTGSGASDRFYDIFIQNFANTSVAKTFDMFVIGGLVCPGGTIFNYNTLGSFVPAQGDAGGGAVSVGAISASDPGIDDIESFSSRGPTNNGVTKPDVAVTGYGGFPSTFTGTSAAASHVAGLAALLLEVNPELLSGEQGDVPAATVTPVPTPTPVSTATATVVPTATPTITPMPVASLVPLPSGSPWALLVLGGLFPTASRRLRVPASLPLVDQMGHPTPHVHAVQFQGNGVTGGVAGGDTGPLPERIVGQLDKGVPPGLVIEDHDVEAAQAVFLGEGPAQIFQKPVALSLLLESGQLPYPHVGAARH